MECTNLSLVEQIQRKILQYIVDHNIQPGALLPKENELVEILGVSRIVVREALSSLRTLGIIETKRKKGTVLASPDMFGAIKLIINSGALNIEALRDLYELRLMLEIGLADFLFLRKTDEDIKLLRSIVEQEELASTTEESIQLDILFHKTLYRIVGNKSLESFQKLLGQLFAIYAPRKKDWKVKQIITHASLVEILQAGSPDSFRVGMRLHLNTQFENMKEILEGMEKKKYE